MTSTNSSREAARHGDGKFGEQARPESTVALEDGERLWTLTVKYSATGDTGVFSIKKDGMLPVPHRSDYKTMYALVGFAAQKLSSEVAYPWEDAPGFENRVVGLVPLFMTNDGQVGLLATVVSLVEVV